MRCFLIGCTLGVAGQIQLDAPLEHLARPPESGFPAVAIDHRPCSSIPGPASPSALGRVTMLPDQQPLAVFCGGLEERL